MTVHVAPVRLARVGGHGGGEEQDERSKENPFVPAVRAGCGPGRNPAAAGVQPADRQAVPVTAAA
ncbi:hypothetical protein D3C71_2064910 [compost metagenome]